MLSTASEQRSESSEEVASLERSLLVVRVCLKRAEIGM